MLMRQRRSFQLLFILASAGLTWGQSYSGAIVGTLTDPAASAVPNVQVAAIEVRTNVSTTATSDAEGNYNFPALRPGVYRLEAQAQGFQKLVRSGIEVQVNDRLRIDLRMELGAITENVMVSGSAPLVQSETGALGTVINNQKIINLPLNTRDPFQLLQLSPGVLPSPVAGDAFNNAIAYGVNGARGNTSEVYIDGVANTIPGANPINILGVFPSVDALEEFKLQSNSFAAEYGRSGGGVVNMVMKSGTNQIHGVAFEFLRNSKMDSNNFFANRAGRPLGSFKRNQFGGGAGGPIVKNKAFFFVNYEALRQRAQSNYTFTVPTAEERTGNFSAIMRQAGSACVPLQLYDPFTTRPTGTGGYVRDLVPGARIPASRFDPVGANVVKYFPLPNSAGDPCKGTNNFFSSGSSKYNTDQMDMKFDFDPGEKDRITVGLGWLQRVSYDPNVYGNYADSRFFNGDRTPARSIRLNYTRTQSATFVMNGLAGVARMKRSDELTVPSNFSITQLGFPQSLANQVTGPMFFPDFTFTNYPELGRGLADYSQAGTTYSGSFSLTKIHGRHTIKWGIDGRINQVAESRSGARMGNYAFGPGFTQGPDPTRPGPAQGDDIASLLFGLGSGSLQSLPGIMAANHYIGLYVQDDFRVSSRLTLNFGLRYDLELGRTERYNQLSYFDFNVPSPIAQQVGLPNLRGGVRYAGINGNPRSQFDPDTNNFAPRFSLAYTVTPKTVIRSGFGIFYLPFVGAAIGRQAGEPGFTATTNWASSYDNVTPNFTLSNPFPNGLNPRQAPAAGLLTDYGLGLTGTDAAIDRSTRVGYSEQWNFNVQRQLGSSASIEAAYAGSRGIKLPDGPAGIEYDQLTPQQLALGTSLLDNVPNPFYGIITTGTLSGPTITRRQLLRPYPQYLSVISKNPGAAASTYHSFQLRVDKRFSNGTLSLAYTNSKLIDDSSQAVNFLGPAVGHQNSYNRRADRSLSSLDISQRLVIAYVYGVPIGRGKRIGSTMVRPLDWILGNWQVNGITTFSTGVPLAIVNAQNNSQSFSQTQRPNVTGDPNLSGGRSTTEKLANWFNTGVFSQPAPFTFGNLGRVLPNVRSDGLRNFDFSLFKDFPIHDTKRLELRGECFNLMNTPTFGPPNLSFGSAAFGTVTSQGSTTPVVQASGGGAGNGPRQVQLGLKFYF